MSLIPFISLGFRYVLELLRMRVCIERMSPALASRGLLIMDTSEKKSKISFVDANITSIMSVSLVLLLLGVGAILGLFAREVTGQIKANIGFDVSMTDAASDGEILRLKRQLAAAPYTASVKYISKEEALHYWQQETGEDLMEVLGFNPLTAEFEVHVEPDYASVDSLMMIKSQLSRNTAIDEVQIHQDQVERINRNINNIVAVLGVVAVVLMVISFALINNTVRLTVYSRRFLIHTMKLVGATPGFIRKPIVVSNIINGIIAAFVAMAILSAGLFYINRMEPMWAMMAPMAEVWCVFGALVVLGALMCGIAAVLASNKFIKLGYDDLFKR